MERYKYPQEVLTKSKKGKVELRLLIDKGSFVRYRYVDPESGKPSENKIRLVLFGKQQEEFFIVPMKDGRFLMIPAEPKKERMVWDGKKAQKL